MNYSTDKLPVAREIGGGVYGDHIFAKEDLIPKAKEALLEQIVDTIRELAKQDNFWIVKRKEDFKDYPIGIYSAYEDGEASVAWKINIPSMEPPKPEEDWQERMRSEYWQTKNRYNNLCYMLEQHEAGTLEFTPKCSIELLTSQKEAMGKYLDCLKERAKEEGFELSRFKKDPETGRFILR